MAMKEANKEDGNDAESQGAKSDSNDK